MNISKLFPQPWVDNANLNAGIMVMQIKKQVIARTHALQGMPMIPHTNVWLTVGTVRSKIN